MRNSLLFVYNVKLGLNSIFRCSISLKFDNFSLAFDHKLQVIYNLKLLINPYVQRIMLFIVSILKWFCISQDFWYSSVHHLLGNLNCFLAQFFSNKGESWNSFLRAITRCGAVLLGKSICILLWSAWSNFRFLGLE